MYKECGEGVHAPTALVFIDLCTSWFRGVGRGLGGGRGRGRGRGGGCSGRGAGRNSQDGGPGEFMDGYEHPDATMYEADHNRKCTSELAAPTDRASTVAATATLANGANKGNILALPPPKIP